MPNSPTPAETMMNTRHRWSCIPLLVAVLCLGATGCGPERATPPDTPGEMARADTVVLDPAVIVGVDDGDPDYLFGAVSSVAADIDGRLYVGDRMEVTVRGFDANGRFLGRILRRGGGPGEVIQVPADVVFGPDHRLYVRDGPRIMVLGPRHGGILPDSVVALWSTPGGGNLTSTRSAPTRDGKYFYPGGLFLPNELPRRFYVSYTRGRVDGDTLEVPPYPGLASTRPALFPLGAGTGDFMMLRGLNRVPFSSVPVWAVTPDGTLLSSDGASATLLETDANGDTLRILQLPPRPPRHVPRGERADSLAALEERIARVPGPLNLVVGLGEGVTERRLPQVLPEVIGLSVATDGSIWVERWPPEDQHQFRYFDVLDSDGRFRHVVIFRAPLVRDPPVWFGERSIAGILRDPNTGIERVARFDLP